eukprot:15293663-Alexandrium_andersonii.AAC.1
MNDGGSMAFLVQPSNRCSAHIGACETPVITGASLCRGATAVQHHQLLVVPPPVLPNRSHRSSATCCQFEQLQHGGKECSHRRSTAVSGRQRHPR